MILGKQEILKAVKEHRITIENFDETKLNPNSYNLTLGNKLLVYTDFPLDAKKDNPTKEIIIPEEGLVLEPGTLYLGYTNEFTETYGYVPMVEGRSSYGRLGLMIHVTAGFGDNGFSGRWTLEIEVEHPLRIYPNMEVCQIYYQSILGDDKDYYNGKYQNSTTVAASRSYKDFE